MVFKKRKRDVPVRPEIHCVACGSTFKTTNRHSTGVIIDRVLSIKNLKTSARKILSCLGYPITTALPKRICEQCMSLTQQIVGQKVKLTETTDRLASAVEASGGSYLKRALASKATLSHKLEDLSRSLIGMGVNVQIVLPSGVTFSPHGEECDKKEEGSRPNVESSLPCSSPPSRKRKVTSPPFTPNIPKRSCAGDAESVTTEGSLSLIRTGKPCSKRSLFCRPSMAPIKHRFRGVAGAASYIQKGQYATGIRQMYKRSKGFKAALHQVIPDLIRSEVTEAVSSSTAFTGEPTKETIENFCWDSNLKDVQQHTPLLVSMLAGATTSKGRQRSLTKGIKRVRSVAPLIGSIISQILFNKRPKQFNLTQKMNAMMLWLAGCKRKMFTKFNRLSLCVGEESARKAIDTVRTNFDQKVKVWKKEVEVALCPEPGRTQNLEDMYGFSITFDNVNQHTISTHQHVNKPTEVEHNMVQAFAAKDRVPSLHLDDTPPTPTQIRELSVENVIPGEEHINQLIAEMKVLVQRVLKEHMPEYEAAEVTDHIPHQFSEESSKKTDMVPLGVLEKDENRTGEMAECMAHYQQFVPCQGDDDPLAIILYGDGLSEERAEAAQRLRSNSGTKLGRLEGLEPCGQEWHLRLLTLEDTFSELYAPSSAKQKGTLFNLRNKFGFTSVSSDVKHKFAHCYEFLELVTEAYVVLLAKKLQQESVAQLTIQEVSDTIVRKCFTDPNTGDMKDTPVPEDVEDFPYCVCREDLGGQMVKCQNKNCPDGKLFHCDCIGMCEDEIPPKWHCSIACSTEDHGANLIRKSKRRSLDPIPQDAQLDSLFEYSRAVIYRGLFLKGMRDAVKENDGPRILLHWRFLMPQFFMWHHPKYFIIGEKLLLSTGGAVSDRLKFQLTWTRTVNGKGGEGNNMAADLKMEQFNRAYKVSCAASRGKLTPATIERHSQMVGIGKELEGVYDTQVAGINTYTSKKDKKAKHETDVAEIIEYLQDENLFNCIPGRQHISFPNYALFTGVRDKPAFLKRFKKHREGMARKIELRARRANRVEGHV